MNSIHQAFELINSGSLPPYRRLVYGYKERLARERDALCCCESHGTNDRTQTTLGRFAPRRNRLSETRLDSCFSWSGRRLVYEYKERLARERDSIARAIRACQVPLRPPPLMGAMWLGMKTEARALAGDRYGGLSRDI